MMELEQNMLDRNIKLGRNGQQPRPFLFVKVARTASESMSLVFREQCLNYIRLGRLKQCQEWYGSHAKGSFPWVSVCHNHFPVPVLRAYKVLPDDWYHPFIKFAFIRNPWDRLVSYWRLYAFTKMSSAVGSAAKGCRSFDQFVDKCQGQGLVNKFAPFGRSYKLINPQWRWLLGDFNFIGCFEKLEDDWCQLNTLLNSRFVLDKHVQLHSDRGSCRKNYLSYYNRRTARLVKQMYRLDIELLGYNDIECDSPYSSDKILQNLAAHWNCHELCRRRTLASERTTK